MTALLVAITVAAVCFTIAFSFPLVISLLANLVFVVIGTAGLTALVVYSSGNTRAFAIGAIFPQGMMLALFITNGTESIAGIPVDALGTPTVVIVPWIASVLAGLLCVGVRIENRNG